MEGGRDAFKGRLALIRASSRLFAALRRGYRAAPAADPWIAAGLSFVFPGLGQIYVREWRQGAAIVVFCVIITLVSVPVGVVPISLGYLIFRFAPPPVGMPLFILPEPLATVAVALFVPLIPGGWCLWLFSIVRGYRGAFEFREAHPPKACPHCDDLVRWNAKACPRCSEPFPILRRTRLFRRHPGA